MNKKDTKDIIVLDLETQKSFDDVGGRHNLAKLKVSVAGIYSFRKDKFLTFWENDLKKLDKILQNVGLVIGFNIRKFDYPVLAPYLSFDPRILPSLDIMKEIEQQVGHRVSLNSVAEATLGCYKSGDGLEAIRLYHDRELEKLKNYCLDDVRLTRDIFNYGRTQGKIYFSSNYGGRQAVLVDWRFYDFFGTTKKKKITKAEKTKSKKLEFDDFELFDIYQSLLVRAAIGELTENDDKSGAVEKIKKVLSQEHIDYCKQRAKEVISGLENAIYDSVDNGDYHDDFSYSRYSNKKSFAVDQNLENDIKDAFQKRRIIEIDYESAATRAGEPFLKKRQVNIYEIDGGYFDGYCHLRKETRRFRMDRVVSFKALNKKYKLPEDSY